MGVANNYTCYRQLYRLVPVLFTPVQQFHPTCLCTFYTTSTLYLFKFWGENVYYGIASPLFFVPGLLYIIVNSVILNTVYCTHRMMVFVKQ